MKIISEIIIILTLLYGSGFVTKKVYFEVKKTTLHQIQKGLPSLEGYAEKLTEKHNVDF